MSIQSTGVALLLLIAPVLAALGPPPGARGKIDFRYPDYIVHERPHCPYEGVFPHPRNCSWYYRCHDPYQIGFYHQFYFECEPGTMFSDELDQCIHPFNQQYPCNLAPPTTEAAQLDVEDCYDSMIRCKIYLCPNSNEVMLYIGRLCQSAFHTCQNGTQLQYCSNGQYYDVLSRMCTQDPAERGCVDEETFDSTARPPITTTTTTTTPSTTVASTDDCYDSMVECRPYQCPDTAQKEYLCRKAFQTCLGTKMTFYCGSGNYFNYETRQCVDVPLTRGCVELLEGEPSTTQAPTTAISIDPSLLTFSFTVTCSVENPRPREERLAQYYCTDYPTCLPGKRRTRMELCLKYLQCVRNNNEWKAVIMECPPGLYFSYENDICTSKPKGDCPFDETEGSDEEDDRKNAINLRT